MSHENHNLAHEIVKQALQRHVDPDRDRLPNDDLLIVMGAVLEEVSFRWSRRCRVAIGSGITGGLAGFGVIAVMVAKALGV